MRSGLVPSLNINHGNHRVSQLDETGMVHLNNMPSATKSRYPPIQKEELGMSGFWLIETKLLKCQRAY
jgi:hypothetical protein